MAYKKHRIRQFNQDGAYDVLHLESRSDLIVRFDDDGQVAGNVEDSLASLEEAIAGVDYSGKADKVASATSGNFAGLDANGNLTDSGKKASDFATSGHNHNSAYAAKSLETTVSNHTSDSAIHVTSSDKSSWNTAATKAAANETAIAAIKDGTSLDSFKDVETALAGKSDSDHTHTDASTSAAGFMTATMVTKLNGIEANANKYTHPSFTAVAAAAKKVGMNNQGHVVLGDALTAADVGAAASGHTHNYAGSSSAGGAANSVKSKLTFGTKTFDGSAAQTITAEDLGLTKVMNFLGTTTTAISDGSTTNPITIGGASVTAKSGDVVLYDHFEYLWDGGNTCWERLGGDEQYSVVGHTHTVSEITDIASNYAAKSHAHGNVTNDGKITAAGVALQNGDSLVFIDSNDSSKIKKTTITFDGTTKNKALTPAGTWEAISNYEHPTHTATSGFNKITSDELGHVSSVTAVAASDVKGLSGIDMTAATSGAAGAHGMVPQPGAGANTKFLRGDATWQSVITSETQLSKGTDSSGTAGVTFVQDVAVSNHKITLTKASVSAASSTAAGLMSSAHYTKLEGIEANANNYTHPAYTAADAAAKKVGLDATGHVVLGAALTASDVGAAASSHAHGNVTSGGAITATAVTIANGDALTIVDSSASGKLVKSSITFDASTTTQALTKAGTWATFNNYSHPTTAGNKHIPSGGAAGQHLVYGDASGTAAWANYVDISFSASQPTTQKTNDLWFETIS